MHITGITRTILHYCETLFHNRQSSEIESLKANQVELHANIHECISYQHNYLHDELCKISHNTVQECWRNIPLNVVYVYLT